ncbi:MAG: PKD domain-containing protein [bacterium]|nr:PKD domain-containing protein [bacterium]
MQLGSTSGGNGIFYNWKRNGVWGGYSAIPATGGAVHQSVDLTQDGEIAAVAYGMKDTAVMLVSSAPISATGSLETEFSHPDMVFWGSEVSFDASQSTDLNPDYNIVSYEWDFGDGTTETTTGPTVSHSYNAYGIDVTVTLTINAETGETGTITKDIRIHALFNAIISAVNARRIKTLFYDRAANELHWNANPLNVNAGYPAITTYEIWRAPLGSSLTGDAFVRLAEVDAGTATFLDYQDVVEGAHYVYSIRSVDVEGHISPFDHYSNDDSQKIKAEIIKRRLSL